MERRSRVDGRGGQGPAEELRRRVAALVALTQGLSGFVAEETAGGVLVMRRVARALVEIERAVARILEAEQAWHDWNDGTGRPGDESGAGGDIDFDAARHEIGCRLARLRECCRPD